MSRATIVALVLLVVIAAGAVVVHRSMGQAQERKMVQRLDSQRRLRQFADAFAAYRARHGSWPDTLFQLMKDQRLPFGSNLVRGGGSYRYRAPAATATGAVVLWSGMLHAAILPGELLSADQRAERELPPVGYVLTADGRIEELEEAAYRQRIKDLPAADP